MLSPRGLRLQATYLRDSAIKHIQKFEATGALAFVERSSDQH